jgi:hypothetical protein
MSEDAEVNFDDNYSQHGSPKGSIHRRVTHPEQTYIAHNENDDRIFNGVVIRENETFPKSYEDESSMNLK